MENKLRQSVRDPFCAAEVHKHFLQQRYTGHLFSFLNFLFVTFNKSRLHKQMCILHRSTLNCNNNNVSKHPARLLLVGQTGNRCVTLLKQSGQCSENTLVFLVFQSCFTYSCFYTLNWGKKKYLKTLITCNSDLTL